MLDLKIAFMGTPYFAVPTLKALIKHNFQVVAVVTAPDKPAGRGQKLQISEVKKEALNHHIPILQPLNLKSPEFLEHLKSLGVTLQIVVAFRMLPEAIWKLPKYGTFNLHASLLPDYRGAAPINWALINGETKTGVTTFFIDEKIDTGAIIFQSEIKINTTEDAGELHDKLMNIGSELVIKTVQNIANETIVKIPQANFSFKQAPKLHPDNCKIDWQNNALVIYNKIRGLSPYPAAWCFLKVDNELIKLKIFKSTLIFETHSLKVGTLIADKKTIKIACADGFVEILELQLAGKKRMDAVSFLNGFKFNASPMLV